jgi:teichuronic acid biosynthesis glycosyltransferase TuaG
VLNKNLTDFVTVIIPYYKKINFINECVDSVLNQTFQNFEIIMVYDDKDKSELELLEKFKNKDKRIKIIVNQENLGVGESRNKALKIANGKFIAFLDADDIWHPLKLSTQIEFMINNNFSITHTSYNIINEKNKKVGIRFAKNLKFSDLIRSCDIGLSTVIIEKKLLDNLCFPNLKTKEDYVLWLQLTKKGYEFKAFDEFLTDWRLAKNSLSSSTFRKLIDGYNVYRKYLEQSILKSLINLLILSLNFLRKK